MLEMKFEVFTDYEKLKFYKSTKIQEELDSFINMKTDVVKCLTGKGEYKSLASASSSYNAAAKRYSIPARALIRNRTLYLVRTDRGIFKK